MLSHVSTQPVDWTSVKTITCLNCTMISFESSMSLNIPSNLLVKAAPHSKINNKKQSVITLFSEIVTLGPVSLNNLLK